MKLCNIQKIVSFESLKDAKFVRVNVFTAQIDGYFTYYIRSDKSIFLAHGLIFGYFP